MADAKLTPEEARAKADQLNYLKARQQSILVKIEDLERAVSSGFTLDSYEPEDLSLETQQPTDSQFAKAFYEAEKKVKASGGEVANLVAFRGSDASTPSRAPPSEPSPKAPAAPTSPAAPAASRFKGPRTEAQLKTDHALLNACYFGNTNGVMKLIRQGADVEYMEERDGWCAIHYAARWGDVKMLMALLNAGADVNLRTNGKETALHKATRWDQKDVAVLLLKRGALAHFRNGDGKKASDMTADKDLAYICDNFEQWCEEEKERIKREEAERAEDRKRQAILDSQEARAREAEEKHRQEVRERRLAGLRTTKSGTVSRSPSPSRR